MIDSYSFEFSSFELGILLRALEKNKDNEHEKEIIEELITRIENNYYK